MSFSHVVITAGISAIGERNVLGRLLRSTPGPLRFIERKQNPELALGSNEGEAIEHVRKLASTEECRAAAAASPKDVSAEYSLTHALKQRDMLHAEPTVVLLHTATLSGKVAAAAVASLMEVQFSCRCLLREVDSFDVSDTEKLKCGLGAFMHQVVNELRVVDASYACFAPQGGYKVMTSLGYVAGSFLKYPTAYLHEDNQTLHIIPPIPVALSPREQVDLGRLARQVQRQPNLSLLSESDRESVFAHPWLFEVASGLVVPNAFAQFLGLETHPILLSPDATKTLAQVHNAQAIRRRLLTLPALVGQFNKRAGDYANILDHERTFPNLNPPQTRPNFHIWKAAGGDFYVAWMEGKDGALLINRIWGAGHTYNKDAEAAHPGNSQGLFDDPAGVAWAALEQEDDEAPGDKRTEITSAVVDTSAKDRSSADEEFRQMKRTLKEQNKKNTEAMQRNAELRRTVSSQGLAIETLKHEKSLLKMLAESLQRQLAETTADDSPTGGDGSTHRLS